RSGRRGSPRPSRSSRTPPRSPGPPRRTRRGPPPRRRTGPAGASGTPGVGQLADGLGGDAALLVHGPGPLGDARQQSAHGVQHLVAHPPAPVSVLRGQPNPAIEGHHAAGPPGGRASRPAGLADLGSDLRPTVRITPPSLKG